MSGHSKWSNIRRKKEKVDGAKAKVFTKIGREIMVAAKEGGCDPANNSKLRELIAKAKAANVPSDNINRLLQKVGNKDNMEEILYEGYGPGGVAVMAECLTDNRNRTAGDLRHYFDKCGGNLGQSGSVSFLFQRKGMIYVALEEEVSEEKVLEDCMEAGALDFELEDQLLTFVTEPNDVFGVADRLEELGYESESAQAEYVPLSRTALKDEDMAVKMQKLLELLEDNDDVQAVYHNWDEPEEEA